MKLMRYFVLLLTIALLSAAVVLAQDEHVLVTGNVESTGSLDPARGYTHTTSVVLKATYQTLVTFPDDSAAEILPQLATDWTISDDSLTYTFNLDPSALFCDGSPITADD